MSILKESEKRQWRRSIWKRRKRRKWSNLLEGKRGVGDGRRRADDGVGLERMRETVKEWVGGEEGCCVEG